MPLWIVQDIQKCFDWYFPKSLFLQLSINHGERSEHSVIIWWVRTLLSFIWKPRGICLKTQNIFFSFWLCKGHIILDQKWDLCYLRLWVLSLSSLCSGVCMTFSTVFIPCEFSFPIRCQDLFNSTFKNCFKNLLTEYWSSLEPFCTV